MNPAGVVPPLSGHLESFREILGQLSLTTTIPMLGARQRWKLVVELLLGHALVRGGRTRDFPFSSQRLLCSEIASQLARHRFSFCPGMNRDRLASFSAYDLIVAILLVETGKPIFLNDDVDSERYFSAALMSLMELLFGVEDHQTLWNLLGISIEGLEAAKRHRTSYNRTSLKLAKVVASLANKAIPPGQQQTPGTYLLQFYDLPQKTMEELQGINVSLIYLKTKKIQSYLDRCSLPFIQRGASYWCSQISSRVRDIVSSLNEDRSVMLIDSDAITIMACPPGIQTEQLIQKVKSCLVDSDDALQLSEPFLRQHYPRLVPYYLVARKEQHPTINVLPAFGIEVREAKSLFELAIERTFREPVEDCAESHFILDLGKVPLMHSAATCSGRTGDNRLTSMEYAVPGWYNPNGDQGYGWASIVFSLAGLSYNRMTNESMQDILYLRHGLRVKTVKTQKELLQQADDGSKRVSYLKFDGDQIGRKFSNIPLILRPSLSLRLENLMREAWLLALARLVQSFGLSSLPADLLYFGGDDMLSVFPENICSQFVELFDCALSQLHEDDLNITFTYAIISDTPLASTIGNYKSETSGQPRVIHQVNKLLAKAKAIRRGENAIEDLAWLQHVAGLSM